MTAPIPAGFHSLTPYLVVKDAALAIEFYKQAFGATELVRLQGPDGKLAHAELRIGDSPLMLSDEIPAWGNFGPELSQASAGHIHLYVNDADRTVAEAVAAGAKVLISVADQFYGDRGGRVADPFGHIWIIATHKHDVPVQEMQARFEAMLRSAGQS